MNDCTDRPLSWRLGLRDASQRVFRHQIRIRCEFIESWGPANIRPCLTSDHASGSGMMMAQPITRIVPLHTVTGSDGSCLGLRHALMSSSHFSQPAISFSVRSAMCGILASA